MLTTKAIYTLKEVINVMKDKTILVDTGIDTKTVNKGEFVDRWLKHFKQIALIIKAELTDIIPFTGNLSEELRTEAQKMGEEASNQALFALSQARLGFEFIKSEIKNLNIETSKIKPISGGSSGSSGGSGERTPAREITLMPIIDAKAIEPIKATTHVITENFYNATRAADALSKKIEETEQVAGSAFMSMADNSEASLGEMGAAAANAAREIIKIEAAKAVAGFAASIFASVPFPINLMLAAAAGSIAGSLFAKIIPPFAEGGLVSGATLGMVGEGRGTSMVNPEVIAPLDKLQGMLNQGGSTEVFGRISGSDILLSSDRARGNRKRTRGN